MKEAYIYLGFWFLHSLTFLLAVNCFSTLPPLAVVTSLFITINSWLLDLDFKNLTHWPPSSIHPALISSFQKTFSLLLLIYLFFSNHLLALWHGPYLKFFLTLSPLSCAFSNLVKMQLSTPFLPPYLQHPGSVLETSRGSLSIWLLKNDGCLMGRIMQFCKVYLESFISSRMSRVTGDNMGETLSY